MKFAIMDSGPLISLTLNGLLSTIRRLKENYPNVHFVITPSVKRETVEKGLTIKKYELEAVKIQDLIDKKILTLSSEFVKPNVLAKETSINQFGQIKSF
jgi:hypothetical protein